MKGWEVWEPFGFFYLFTGIIIIIITTTISLSLFNYHFQSPISLGLIEHLCWCSNLYNHGMRTYIDCMNKCHGLKGVCSFGIFVDITTIGVAKQKPAGLTGKGLVKVVYGPKPTYLF